MIRRFRTTQKLLLVAVAAALNAGCAQTSGTYIAGDNSSPVDWPVPKVDQTPPPTPPEPTLLPQAVIPPTPAEPQAATETPRRATAPRRSATVPAATPAPAPRAVTAKAAVPSGPRDVWQRVRNGFQMPSLDVSLVGDWENYYASRPDYFAQMIQNSSHFMYHIANEVERRGMPQEIALLPMIESAYNPVAYSSAHASGIWQFIPSTGKNYGPEAKLVVRRSSRRHRRDQRRARLPADALRHVQRLGTGARRLQLGRRRRAARGGTQPGARLPTDYRSLENMPAETRNYVPKLIAVKNIIANPGRFGLTLQHVPNEPYFEVVTLRRHIDVARAAQSPT